MKITKQDAGKIFYHKLTGRLCVMETLPQYHSEAVFIDMNETAVFYMIFNDKRYDDISILRPATKKETELWSVINL